ncbi:MAG: AAA family ATPase [Gemmataceae bacterium]
MKVVFVTGKQGSGKSFVAKTLAGEGLAACIDVDSILVGGAKKWLDAADRDPTEWALWEEKAKRSDLRPVLRDTIHDRYGSLAASGNDLVAEGAILCNDWFLEPFVEVLFEALKLKDAEQYFIYVNPSDAVLFANILHRAKRIPSRRHELKIFTSVRATGDRHAGFVRSISTERWTSLETKEEALERVKQILLATSRT